jgi:hypothetical protein
MSTTGKRAAEKCEKKSASRVALPITTCAIIAAAAIVAASTGDDLLGSRVGIGSDYSPRVASPRSIP